MDKSNIKKSFENKKFKYGGYATVTTAVVLAILVIVNLFAGQLNLKFDLTKNKLYSLSDQTYKVLSGLKDNVNIYVFEEAGKEDPMMKSIIDKYQTGSKNVTLTYKDPVKYPQFAQQFSQNGTQVSAGSVVVQAGQKFKLINSADMLNYGYDATEKPSYFSITNASLSGTYETVKHHMLVFGSNNKA